MKNVYIFLDTLSLSTVNRPKSISEQQVADPKQWGQMRNETEMPHFISGF